MSGRSTHGGRRGWGGFSQTSNNNNLADTRSDTLKHFPPSTSTYELPFIDWDVKRAEWIAQRKAKFEGLAPVVKNFYTEDAAVAAMSRKQVAKCRLENKKISVSYKDREECNDAPNPVRTFKEAWQHYPDLLELLEGRYEKPSPIQMQLWPVLLSGRDAIGIAQTGTGKTLAFLLPGLVNIMNQPGNNFNRPCMVVLAPTRELALQIDEEVNKLNYVKIKSVCVYGKGDRRKQLDGIAAGAQVVVATPGRLDDLVRQKEIDLRQVSYVVFDEADKMLDMGFMHHLTYIISAIRDDRQFIMTSATWSTDIHYIAKNYLKQEILVRVGERELEAASTVTQEVRVCEEEEKFAILMEFVKKCGRQDKGLVFVNRRASCDPLYGDICAHYNYKYNKDTMMPETLYGSMDQEAREESLKSFRKSEARLLICTDVAARGLDVLDVTFVIHYDLPMNLEEYVHRSGRTGRAGRTGHVLTLVCWKDRRLVRNFIKILERSSTNVPSELRRLADRADRSQARRNEMGGGGRGGGGTGSYRGRDDGRRGGRDDGRRGGRDDGRRGGRDDGRRGGRDGGGDCGWKYNNKSHSSNSFQHKQHHSYNGVIASGIAEQAWEDTTPVSHSTDGGKHSRTYHVAAVASASEEQSAQYAKLGTSKTGCDPQHVSRLTSCMSTVDINVKN